MGKATRKRYRAAFKAKFALEALKGELRVADLEIGGTTEAWV